MVKRLAVGAGLVGKDRAERPDVSAGGIQQRQLNLKAISGLVDFEDWFPGPDDTHIILISFLADPSDVRRNDDDVRRARGLYVQSENQELPVLVQGGIDEFLGDACGRRIGNRSEERSCRE